MHAQPIFVVLSTNDVNSIVTKEYIELMTLQHMLPSACVDVDTFLGDSSVLVPCGIFIFREVPIFFIYSSSIALTNDLKMTQGDC